MVGGAVRDALLGLPVKDRDHVVVGATPEAMAELGFRPVGADFPVFLHPETHEEYALARTERKSAPGYRGFTFHASPEVTLEEDLRRRDLTINAMARGEDGVLVDPHGGEADLRTGVLRHVGPAFTEDPVRILRVARFAARFGFAVAPETLVLMKRMVDSGEVDALVPERVWQELARGLMAGTPSRMVTVLSDCGALARVLPEIAAAWEANPRLPERIDAAAARDTPLPVRFAALAMDLDAEAVARLCARVNAPGDCRDLALIAAREAARLRDPGVLGGAELLGLLERTDAFRRPERLGQLLDVADADAQVREQRACGARAAIERALEAARSVDAGAVARENPGDIAGAVRSARRSAIEAAAAG